jgi:ribosomal protein L36
MIVTKKVGQDAFAQIVREENTLVNIIPLNPEYMRTVCNRKGRVIRYEYTNGKGEAVKFKPKEIFHLCNNRVVNEGHGVSDVEAVEWNVEAVEEAKRTHRKMVKRNGVVRVIEVDTEDAAKIAALKVQWKTAIENGDVLIMPKGVAEAKDWHGNLDTAGVIAWLDYMDNDFYMSIGVPRVILGGAENTIEAGSKIGMLSFEQVYWREQTELEADIWNQLYIRIKFNKPASLMDIAGNTGISQPNDMMKNQSQTGFQPNDVQAGAGK